MSELLITFFHIEGMLSLLLLGFLLKYLYFWYKSYLLQQKREKIGISRVCGLYSGILYNFFWKMMEPPGYRRISGNYRPRNFNNVDKEKEERIHDNQVNKFSSDRDKEEG